MRAEDYISKFGIKPSVQRVAVMKYLLTHKTHPTVEEIYDALHDEITTLSKTTIYNTLKLFVEHGAAAQLNIEDKCVHFDGDISAHAHFMCQRCGTIYDICPSKLPIIEDFASLQFGAHNVQNVQLNLTGICEKCMKNKNKESKQNKL